MSFLQQQLFQFQGKSRSANSITYTAVLEKQTFSEEEETASRTILRNRKTIRKQLINFHHSIKSIGATAVMDDFEKRKLGIFNQLNFFQLITGICIPVIGLFGNAKFPEWAWLIVSAPACISIIALWLNSMHKYEVAIVVYFICYPVATSIVYMSGINVGFELFFILYGVLSVFFIQQISHMLFSVALSMISYFMLAVVWKDHRFQLESSNMFLYLFNQFAGIVFIFYGLFLIKKENIRYQASVLSKSSELANNAVLLQKQTAELTELNSLKNKLFSVIAHDLKTPMYSLRTMFRNIQQQDVPPKKIKAMLPDMINNLNYTTGLMENLLQWAKCQMHAESVKIQMIDVAKIIEQVIGLMELQIQEKELTVENRTDGPVLVMADKDMISLVMRNLLSNAVKFTNKKGAIVIEVTETAVHAEIRIKDNGMGISPEALQKINQKNYYTTNGTAHEPGTGLGLMLCKEFLLKNGSDLCIQSEPGIGSTFSFSLPSPQ